MAQVSNTKIQRAITIVMLVALFTLSPARAQSQDGRPIADAGLSRYAATDPVQLDGIGSYDPDNSGTLSYTWRQIAGPSVEVTDADTAMPTISGFGFIQTNEIQECEFELVVSDGELTSLPDTVKVIIVPVIGLVTPQLENPPFEPDKPTVIYFGGGDCIFGWNFGIEYLNNGIWAENSNILSFGYGPDPNFTPDDVNAPRTYYRLGDAIIVYLSNVAPDYKQPIQTLGLSTGGQPAVDVGIRLNLTYRDARYAVNRVTFLDATPYCRDYSDSISTFLTSSVDGEQCWIDNYVSTTTDLPGFHTNVLNIAFFMSVHILALDWYSQSVTGEDMNVFNNGVIAGGFWSVVGPGKNLQLASTPGVEKYKFKWYGDASSGYMDFYLRLNHPGRLPEPVTLVGPLDVGDPNGVVLTCEGSENAVGYELLLGPDPYRVMDYNVVCETPNPPTEVITTLPFDETWWTVRIRDQYGSTIYADPIRIDSLSLPIENLSTGKTYHCIQLAIDDANFGDELVVEEGLYFEAIDFKGKNLTVRSTNPDDPAVVAFTVINGNNQDSVVTFSGGEDASCVLAGFTIMGGNTENGGGIYCINNSDPTITNCIITNNSATLGGGGAYTDNSNPTVLNCIFKGNSANLGGGVYSGSGSTTIMNCTFVQNTASWTGGICNFDGSPVLTNCILWDNSDPEISVTAMATYSDIRGGWPGEGNIDADPIFADPDYGDYHLKSQAGRWDPNSQSWVQDDVTSPCIDTGDPNSPVAFEPSPNGGRINMGAYGGTSEASNSP